MRLRELAIGTVALVVWSASAGGAEFSARMFGHDIAIVRDDEGERLEIDGREVLRNYYLSVDEVGLAGSTPVAVGTSSIGGNACGGASFVVSFPAGASPRLDGPVEECRPMSVEFEGDRLTFATGASPGSPGTRWTWAPAGGFRKVGAIEFASDTSKGWDQLRERIASHPADLFDYAVIAGQIEELAGPDLALVQRVLTGVGSGEFQGDWFIGSGCTPHSCTVEEGLIAASLADRTLFLAWKPADGDIVVRPPVDQWPERPRAALREWAKTWP